MKKSVKSVFILVLCAFLTILCGTLVGCGAIYEKVYNDDNKIIRSDTHSSVGSLSISKGNITISYKYFSGVEKLSSSLEVNGGVHLNLDLKYKGEQGKLKLVLTDKSNVYILKEVGWLDGGYADGYSGQLGFDGIPDGKYKLKIVGYKAEFSLELNI